MTYVSKVRKAATDALANYEETKDNEETNHSARLLFEILFEIFCNSSSNGNCLLDYRLSDSSIDNDNTCFIRFLLVDKDLFIKNNQLKYILSVEYKKETEQNIKNKQVSPIISLRSVYGDESHTHLLDIKIPVNIIEIDKNEFATMFETATINGMRYLNNEFIIPAIMRYKNEQTPTDLDQSFQTQCSL